MPLSSPLPLSDKIVLSILPLVLAIPMVVKNISMPKANTAVAKVKKSRG
jgi:hypothetical protein